MIICRSASLTSSARGITGCLPPRYPAKGRSDGETESSEIASCENVAGHDLPSGEDVSRRTVVVHDDLSLLVDRDAKLGEGDPRPQWIAAKGRLVDWAGPVRLGELEAFGVAVVQRGRIEAPWPSRPVEIVDCLRQHGRLEIERGR